MFRRVLLGSFLAAAGCAGEILWTDAEPGAPVGEPELRITAPEEGSVHVRAAPGSLGVLVALVGVSAEASGPVARVVFADAEGRELAEVAGVDLGFAAQLSRVGDHTIVAKGFDANGAQVATASVGFQVTDPDIADCHEWLDLYGLEYESGPQRQGVAKPVTVTTPINGVAYRYVTRDEPRATFFMDCELALSLARAAPILRARNVLEVADIGVYNYRCIGGGTPPDCPNGISQHAYAKAIDIAGWTTRAGEYLSVNDDWVIDPADEPTCAAPTENEKDRMLHEVICQLKAERVWNTVLTPNYNDAHRNHFHVDLKPGADYLRSSLPIVDVGPDDY